MLEDSSDEDEVLTICTTSSIDVFILNSRVYDHMTHNHDWFEYFKEFNDMIKMSDDRVYNFIDGGSIQIEMHDRMVRKLDWCYVPDLQKKLIYVGTLAKGKLKYSGEMTR